MSAIAALANIMERWKDAHPVGKVLVEIEVDPSAMMMIERELRISSANPWSANFMGVPLTVRHDLSPWQVVLIYERTGAGKE